MSNNKPPKIVIALDSFKGSLSSLEAANAVSSGILKSKKNAEIIKIPVADGGEGTVKTLVDATGGTSHKTLCRDPLFRDVVAEFGLSKDKKTAFIEVAESSGLTLVEPKLLDPLNSNSFGVGEQIKAALDLGARSFILCLGGSATVDGGAGLLQALGARFYEGESELEATPKALIDCTYVDIKNLDPRLKECTFKAACDVDNPLVGKNGSAFIFAPQKGATQKECAFLDRFLLNLGRRYEESTHTSILDKPRMGASGGIPAALTAFFNAELVPGISLVLDYLDFRTKIKGANLIITGEGSLDLQSLGGKTPIGVCKASSAENIPVIALAGKVETNSSILQETGFKAVFSIAPGPITLQESIERAGELLAFTAENVINLLF